MPVKTLRRPVEALAGRRLSARRAAAPRERAS